MRIAEIRLLVGSYTPQDRIDSHVARILNLHKLAADQAGRVDVVKWDGSTPLGDYADKETRLYADPDVGNGLTELSDIRAWAQYWKPITAIRSALAGETERQRALPLFVYSGGAPGVAGLKDSV